MNLVVVVCSGALSLRRTVQSMTLITNGNSATNVEVRVYGSVGVTANLKKKLNETNNQKNNDNNLTRQYKQTGSTLLPGAACTRRKEA